jgi:hypothetical protein
VNNIAEIILTMVGVLTILLGLYYVLQIFLRGQELFLFRLRRALVSVALCAFGLALKQGWPFSLLLALAPVALMRAPKRNRRIPRSVRQAVIERDLKGQPFDGQIYHLDHTLPFSKGGDHSIKNLRVVHKDYNLQRGAKMPGLLDFMGRKPGIRNGAGGQFRTAWPQPRRLAGFTILLAMLGLVLYSSPKRGGRTRNNGEATRTPRAPAASRETGPAVKAEPTQAQSQQAADVPPSPASPTPDRQLNSPPENPGDTEAPAPQSASQTDPRDATTPPEATETESVPSSSVVLPPVESVPTTSLVRAESVPSTPGGPPLYSTTAQTRRDTRREVMRISPPVNPAENRIERRAVNVKPHR